jgi:hypothetical protein
MRLPAVEAGSGCGGDRRRRNEANRSTRQGPGAGGVRKREWVRLVIYVVPGSRGCTESGVGWPARKGFVRVNSYHPIHSVQRRCLGGYSNYRVFNHIIVVTGIRGEAARKGRNHCGSDGRPCRHSLPATVVREEEYCMTPAIQRTHDLSEELSPAPQD